MEQIAPSRFTFASRIVYEHAGIRVRGGEGGGGEYHVAVSRGLRSRVCDIARSS